MEIVKNGISASFHNSDCIIVSIMQSVMKFFKYDLDQDWYYLIGNGRLLSLPFILDSNEYYFSILAYINEVCYFSGAYYYDFVTQDIKGFKNKLKEKWLEWSDLKQQIPIIVAVENIKNNTEIFILVNYNENNGDFEFFDCNKNFFTINQEDAFMDANYVGFVTIDVPYNFMVKNDYYIDKEVSSFHILKKIGVSLENAKCMIDFFSDMSDKKILSDGQRNNIKVLCESLVIRGITDDLYRCKLGKVYIELGFKKIGEEYIQQGNMWKRFVQNYHSGSIDEILLSEIVCKELELIERNKMIL